MSIGLILGKFYPPHAGHHFLIDYALERVDKLVVLIWWSETESISGEDRKVIVEQMHPKAEVYAEQCEIVPDYESDDVWEKHIELMMNQPMRQFVYRDENFHVTSRFDYVFTSENYGEELARRLDAEHILVDTERINMPISGTAIREDPARHWHYLAEPTRALLTKRFVITGAESTGSTTLAKSLAAHYNTIWVPEYGRLYSEGTKGLHSEWDENEFIHIAQKQNEIEDFMARKAGPVMFCDTDALSTGVWHERYRWYRSQAVEKHIRNHYARYFITDQAEVALEQDGTRDGNDQIRADMQDRIVERILENPVALLTMVEGGPKMRLAHAADIVDGHLDRGWNLNPPLGS